jgi:hypothetical protein
MMKKEVQCIDSRDATGTDVTSVFGIAKMSDSSRLNVIVQS